LAAENAPIGCLLIAHNIPNFVITPELRAILDRSQNVVLLDFATGELLRYGNVAVALPTLTVFEKSGTFVNRGGLSQTFDRVMEPVTYGMPETELIAALRTEAKSGVKA
jgi:predicted molibdopterin-dependent oxidoreductase YjgC